MISGIIYWLSYWTLTWFYFELVPTTTLQSKLKKIGQFAFHTRDGYIDVLLMQLAM